MVSARTTRAIGLVVGTAALAVTAGPTAAAPPAEQTVYEFLEDRPRQYSGYLALAERAGITPFLKAPRKRTWIIPTNAAIANVAGHRLRALRHPSRRAQLRRELMTGVIEGERTPAQLRRGAGRNLRSLLGSPLRISHQGGRMHLNHGARISRTGRRVANGFVYATNTALVKPDRTRAPLYADPSESDLTAHHSCAKSTTDPVVVCTFSTNPGEFVVSDLANVIGAANNQLSGTPVTGDTMMWLVGVGGAGGQGGTFGGCCKGGVRGNAGGAAMFTTVNTMVESYGTSALYYYVGTVGSDGGLSPGIAGGGGSSTIVSVEPPPDPDDWKAPPLDDVLTIAGGGGGGGAASGNSDGGNGGNGAIAVSDDSGASDTTGNAGLGGKRSVGGKGGGRGVGGSAGYPACGSPNWCKGQDGIGGFGAPHTINGTADIAAGWLNEPFYTRASIENKSVNYRLTPGAGGIGQGNGRDCGGGGKDRQACGGGGGAGYGGGAAGQPQDTSFDGFGYDSDKNGGGGGGGGSHAAVGTCKPASNAPTAPPVPLSTAGDGTFSVVVMAGSTKSVVGCT